MKNKKLLFTLSLLICWLWAIDSAAQFPINRPEAPKPTDEIFRSSIIHFDYSFQFPIGKLGERFGPNSSIGGGYWYKTPNNWFLGGDWHFFFGNNMKEDSIAINLINTSTNQIIGINGQPANVSAAMRGFSIEAKVGKLFPLSLNDRNSGLVAVLGIGMFQHKVRLDEPNEAVPQIRGNYIQGYDRLTNGPLLTQYIGFLKVVQHRYMGYSFGIEAMQALTKSRRSFNFDLQRAETDTRLDLQIGLKASFFLALYRKSKTYYTR